VAAGKAKSFFARFASFFFAFFAVNQIFNRKEREESLAKNAKSVSSTFLICVITYEQQEVRALRVG
jgi:hypothetical protein